MRIRKLNHRLAQPQQQKMPIRWIVNLTIRTIRAKRKIRYEKYVAVLVVRIMLMAGCY